jgi:hypothetical protein
MSTSESDSQELMPVRFNVLANCPAGLFMSVGFSSEKGAHYPSAVALIEALNTIGLPGAEIVTCPSNNSYTVTAAQLRELETTAHRH